LVLHAAANAHALRRREAAALADPTSFVATHGFGLAGTSGGGVAGEGGEALWGGGCGDDRFADGRDPSAACWFAQAAVRLAAALPPAQRRRLLLQRRPPHHLTKAPPLLASPAAAGAAPPPPAVLVAALEAATVLSDLLLASGPVVSGAAAGLEALALPSPAVCLAHHKPTAAAAAAAARGWGDALPFSLAHSFAAAGAASTALGRLFSGGAGGGGSERGAEAAVGAATVSPVSVATAVGMVRALAAVVSPKQPEVHFAMVLKRAPTQEEFFRGKVA